MVPLPNATTIAQDSENITKATLPISDELSRKNPEIKAREHTNQKNKQTNNTPKPDSSQGMHGYSNAFNNQFKLRSVNGPRTLSL